jgi:predicted Zn-dependent protease
MSAQLNRNRTLPLCLLVGISCSVVLGQPARALAADGATQRVNIAHVQEIVDDLKGRLAIPQAVAVSIVDQNPLMVSVAPAPGGGFALSFESDFADRLTEDELTAAVAHELGHVWIYTHFPYLQTEQLANEIAMRVVSRESLVPVYAQMFERARIARDVNEYLGEPHPADH